MGEKLRVDFGYELGEVGTRFIAIAIDSFILGLVGSILLSIIGLGEASGATLVVGIVYNWYFWTRQDGQTPGKRMMNLRVVKADGSQLGDIDAMIRAVGYYLSGMLMGLGYIWALIDNKKRTWHDLLAGTIVIATE